MQICFVVTIPPFISVCLYFTYKKLIHLLWIPFLGVFFDYLKAEKISAPYFLFFVLNAKVIDKWEMGVWSWEKWQAGFPSHVMRPWLAGFPVVLGTFLEYSEWPHSTKCLRIHRQTCTPANDKWWIPQIFINNLLYDMRSWACHGFRGNSDIGT